jgi:four helix bundle protein
MEGARRAGRDRTHLCRIAAGSADETRGHLLTAEAWGWLDRAEVEQALDHADHVLAILWKLTR